MNVSRSFWIVRVAVASLLVAICAGVAIAKASSPGKPKNTTVWIVMFSARDCPRCRHVKELARGLKERYPVKIKLFDIDRSADYKLFRRMEAIHGEREFSVPLMMIGDTILMGENAITENLEPTVRKLSKHGGARLPYLGPAAPAKRTAKKAPKADAPPVRRCKECEKKGRPPTVGEELGKIRVYVDQIIEQVTPASK